MNWFVVLWSRTQCLNHIDDLFTNLLMLLILSYCHRPQHLAKGGDSWRQDQQGWLSGTCSQVHDTDIHFISDMFFRSNASLYIFLKGHPSPQCVRYASCSSSHKLITQILYFLEYLDMVNFLHFFVPWLSRTDNFTITAKRLWMFDTNDYFHWQNY